MKEIIQKTGRDLMFNEKLWKNGESMKMEASEAEGFLKLSGFEESGAIKPTKELHLEEEKGN